MRAVNSMVADGADDVQGLRNADMVNTGPLGGGLEGAGESDGETEDAEFGEL